MRAHAAGEYAIQHHSKACSLDTELTTMSECHDAKAALDPSGSAVKSEAYAGTPRGCSRHQGEWYFNSNAKGALDGASEPVCKATAGTAICVYMHSKFTFPFMCI